MKLFVTIVVLALSVLLVAGCGNNPFERSVNSPDGTIPDGAQAFSPDGQYILSEAQPYGKGIVVVSDKDDKEIQRYDILKGGTNDIKALAWSDDSKRFAVMYHGGTKPGISIFALKIDGEIGSVPISKWYHFMTFDKDISKMIVSVDGQSRETLEIKYLNPAETFAIPKGKTDVILVPKPKTTTPVPASIYQKEQDGTVSPFFGRQDIATSPNGDVPHGEKATSPNGKYYACEVEPYEQGNIGVFSMKGKLVQKWEAMSNDNPLKGLAWSPDSERLAIMYHGGMRPAIQVVKIGKKGVVAASEVNTWYHFMAFAKNGQTLLLAESENGPVTKLKPQVIQ